jgi:hypothetical protein
MKATLRASVACAVFLSLAACQDLGLGCTSASVEAEEAVYDRAAQEVLFTVRVVDRRDNPVPDAPVAIIPRYGRENPGGIPLASPTTDAAGVARARIPVEDLKRRRLGLPLTDEWLASFFPHEDINGVFYCIATDDGGLPTELVREVNTAAIN